MSPTLLPPPPPQAFVTDASAGTPFAVRAAAAAALSSLAYALRALVSAGAPLSETDVQIVDNDRPTYAAAIGRRVAELAVAAAAALRAAEAALAAGPPSPADLRRAMGLLEAVRLVRASPSVEAGTVSVPSAAIQRT